MSGCRQHGRPAARAGLLARVAAMAVLLASGSVSMAAPPSGGAKLIRQGTAHDALYDVAFEGERGIAVGAFGRVLVTTDGGTTWQVQPFPMKHLALMAVAMREGRCIAVGQTGIVFTAADCRNWELVLPLTKARLLAVAVNRQGVAYAVGAFGTILKSSDWGQSWAVQTVDWSTITEDGAEPHLYDIHVADDGTVTAVGRIRTRHAHRRRPAVEGPAQGRALPVRSVRRRGRQEDVRHRPEAARCSAAPTAASPGSRTRPAPAPS